MPYYSSLYSQLKDLKRQRRELVSQLKRSKNKEYWKSELKIIDGAIMEAKSIVTRIAETQDKFNFYTERRKS